MLLLIFVIPWEISVSGISLFGSEISLFGRSRGKAFTQGPADPTLRKDFSLFFWHTMGGGEAHYNGSILNLSALLVPQLAAMGISKSGWPTGPRNSPNTMESHIWSGKFPYLVGARGKLTQASLNPGNLAALNALTWLICLIASYEGGREEPSRSGCILSPLLRG